MCSTADELFMLNRDAIVEGQLKKENSLLMRAFALLASSMLAAQLSFSPFSTNTLPLAHRQLTFLPTHSSFEILLMTKKEKGMLHVCLVYAYSPCGNESENFVIS